MSTFSLFQSAPAAEEIQDPTLVKKTYKYWRIRTFYSMYIGYVLYYFTRKSFTFAIPAIQAELGLEKYQIGMISSVFSIAYGASKFLSGILADKSNPRYFMSIGLILTGIFNLFFGFCSGWILFAVFWGLNGWFQGWGWPGCAKLLVHWYSPSERGRWWSIWNTSHNLGGALIPYIVALCSACFGWRYGLYFPGIFCILMGLFLINRLRDTPQSLGLPPVETFRNDIPLSQKMSFEEKELSVKETLQKYVLRNKYIWILAISQLFIYVIRTAVNDWTQLYLIETKGYSYIQAGACVSFFEVGGLFGSLAAGWGSDVVFKGKRNPINVIFTAGIFFLILAVRVFNYSWPVLDGVFLFLFGFFIFGPQMLIGVATAELSHKKAAATATGFGGCFAYIGAMLAGAPLGWITKEWGWDMYLVSLLFCSIMGIALMLPLWNLKHYTKAPQAARVSS